MTQPHRTPVVPHNPLGAALTEICDGCGSSWAMPMQGRYEYYCVGCHSRTVLYTTAEAHLHAMLEPVFTAWASNPRHWLSPEQLREVLEHVTHRLGATLEAPADDSSP